MNELYTVKGQRKYLNRSERDAFLTAAKTFPENVESLCNLLAMSGYRISEALELIPNHFTITFKSRYRGIY